jgi:hypothetical protein
MWLAAVFAAEMASFLTLCDGVGCFRERRNSRRPNDGPALVPFRESAHPTTESVMDIVLPRTEDTMFERMNLAPFRNCRTAVC